MKVKEKPNRFKTDLSQTTGKSRSVVINLPITHERIRAKFKKLALSLLLVDDDSLLVDLDDFSSSETGLVLVPHAGILEALVECGDLGVWSIDKGGSAAHTAHLEESLRFFNDPVLQGGSSFAMDQERGGQERKDEENAIESRRKHFGDHETDCGKDDRKMFSFSDQKRKKVSLIL